MDKKRNKLIDLSNIIKEKIGKTSQKILGVFFIQGLIAGLGLFANVLIARFFGAEALGIYTYFFSLVVIISTLSTFGLQNSVPILLKKKPAKTSSILQISLIISTILSLLVTTISLFVTDYLGLNPNINYFIVSVFIYVLSWAVYIIISNAISAYNFFNLASLFSLLVRVVFTLFIVIIVIMNGDINFLLLSFGLSVLLSLPYMLWRCMLLIPKTLENIAKQELLQVSFPFFLQGVSVFFIYHSDRFVINYFLSFELLGSYSAYSSIINIIRLLSGVFPLVLMPLAATTNYDLKKSLRKLLLFLVPISGGIFIASLWLVPLFYGNEFQYGYGLPAMMALSSVLLVIYSYFNSIYLGEGEMKGKSNVMILDAFLSTIVNIILNTIFISSFGLIGASLGTSITLALKILLNILSIRFLRHKNAGKRLTTD